MSKIVKFVQPSCVPCKMVDMLLDHLGVKEDERYDIAVDESAYELAQKLGVKSTPTIMLLDDNGEELGRVSGLNRDGIVELFNQRG